MPPNGGVDTFLECSRVLPFSRAIFLVISPRNAKVHCKGDEIINSAVAALRAMEPRMLCDELVQSANLPPPPFTSSIPLTLCVALYGRHVVIRVTSPRPLLIG